MTGLLLMVWIAGAGSAASSALDERLARFEQAYRRALVASQRGDIDSTQRGLVVLDSRWRDFTGVFGQSPLPPYDRDPAWPDSIRTIDQALGEARKAAAAGRPAEAHAILEPVRRILRDLRRRNGVDTFDDRLTDFHDAMERVFLRSRSVHEVPLTSEDRRQLGLDMEALAGTFSSLEASAGKVCVRARDLVRETGRIVAAMEVAIRTGAAGNVLRQQSDRMEKAYNDLMLTCR